MSRALIFGAGGQDGHYLTKFLRDLGWLVCAQDRKDTDVTNYDQVARKIFSIRPEHIYMLAGKSTTSHSVLVSQHDAITKGTENVLEAVRKLSPDSKVFIAGSAMQFQADSGAVNYYTPLSFASPYTVARHHAVAMARYYRQEIGLKTYVGYLFNHESPLRKPHHMAQRIALAARHRIKFKCADLDVEKEHGFAGDTVEAMVTLLEQDRYFEAVIGTGVPVSIRRWAELCFAEVGLDYRDYFEQGDERVEYRSLYSNPRVIKSLGWEPKVSVEELARMMVRGE